MLRDRASNLIQLRRSGIINSVWSSCCACVDSTLMLTFAPSMTLGAVAFDASEIHKWGGRPLRPLLEVATIPALV